MCRGGCLPTDRQSYAIRIKLAINRPKNGTAEKGSQMIARSFA
ncbi:hypothetical protein ADIS_1891 [Lunatimonas lonarensis]|uniref:Uncharacterized protein n=1 Tax=Lunatimonas lonarensis TaxID=1232681 RepID=R7ZUC6_9BACT|nr:hypothetical protein ADIS_1891 [Lunatimonas lonarensis]